MTVSLPVYGDIQKTLKEWRVRLERTLSVIQEVVFTDWVDWTPAFPQAGTMTFSPDIIREAKYLLKNKKFEFVVDVEGTTAGTGDITINFTLPFEVSSNNYGGGATTFDGAADIGYWETFSTTLVVVRKQANANWGIGGSKRIKVQGFCEIP